VFVTRMSFQLLVEQLNNAAAEGNKEAVKQVVNEAIVKNDSSHSYS